MRNADDLGRRRSRCSSDGGERGIVKGCGESRAIVNVRGIMNCACEQGSDINRRMVIARVGSRLRAWI